MSEMDTAYHLPEGFNPFFSADRVRALTDALHQLVVDGEITGPKHAVASLHALLEMLRPEAQALQEYLREVENSTTLRLPVSDEDFEALHVRHAGKGDVKEPGAVYIFR